MASTAMIASVSPASQGPSAMWRLTSVHPALVERVAPVWTEKMASVASAHLAPCLLSACLRIIPVRTSPAVMESAMMHLAGSAVCVSLVGVAPAAARAWLQMPVSPSPARLAAPVPVMEEASTVPVPLDFRATSVRCCPPVLQASVSMEATVSLTLAS